MTDRIRTYRRRLSAGLALCALCAAGLVAALSVAPTASAWSIDNLPDGWTIEHIQAVGATACPESYRLWTSGRAAWSDPFCTDSPSFQADVDAFVDGHYTAPVTTTAAAPTTTVVDTTTTAPTTTATAPTETSPVTAPTATAAAPTTATTPAPVVTAPDALAELTARVVALEQQIAALTNRVDRLEKAGEAAWLAYEQELAKGTDSATAADIARGTYLNAVYGLGAFAA